ncbi:MAG TPA: SRPBCC domain-containing protein [Acetobacteraceae bacterium]|nr:SRPBCC domain-containing protein [Acetobacteraceae bacterium]
MAAVTDTEAAEAPELIVSRLIDAPPALVFLAWTTAEHAACWWGPKGFAIESCRLDARPGGSYRVAMRSPEGSLHTKRGVYQEVIPPERLVFTYAWEDADGNPGHEMRITVTFQPRGAQTLLSLYQTGFESVPARDSHRDGWTSCFERFAEFAADMSASALPDRRAG